MQQMVEYSPLLPEDQIVQLGILGAAAMIPAPSLRQQRARRRL